MLRSELVLFKMEDGAQMDKLIIIYNELQALMKHHSEMGHMIKKQEDCMDEIEIASESILEICQRLEQCLEGSKPATSCCCRI